MWRWEFDTEMKGINVKVVLKRTKGKPSLLEKLRIIKTVFENDDFCGFIYDRDFKKRVDREKIKELNSKISDERYRAKNLINKDNPVKELEE